MSCTTSSRVCAMLTCLFLLGGATMAEAQTFRRGVTSRASGSQRGRPSSSPSKKFDTRRVIIAPMPGGQIAEKPLPPGSATNAPVILRGSVIEKRSITIRFKNKATKVSKFTVDRKSERDRDWRTVRTFRTNVNRGVIAPSKIALGPAPGTIYAFRDTGLDPASKYRYRVRATQSNKTSPTELVSATRTITTKPPEPPAAPSNVRVVSTTESTISLTWTDNADNELGFTIYYTLDENGTWQRRNIYAANQTSVTLTELQPDSNYKIKVTVRNGDGQSPPSPSVTHAKTKPASSPPSTVVTKLIYLKVQPVYEGPRPFVATWPAFGTLSGQLTKIEIPKNFGQTYQVHFVKPGYSTAECATNPDATVMLASGQTSTSNQLSEIFGTSKPKFPLTFLACIGATQGSVPDSVGIRITYIKTN